MGGDGGCIQQRADMVKTVGYGFVRDKLGLAGLGHCANTISYQSEDSVSENRRREVTMSQCAISAEPLEDSIVACKLGYLYNKGILLDRLFHKTMPASFAHICALKDVKMCKITREAKDGTLICPVTQMDLRSTKAIINWANGSLLSQRAVDELGAKECPAEGGPFEPIGLAPPEAELERRRAEMERKPKKRSAASTEAAEVKSQAIPAVGSTRVDSLTRTEADTEHIRKKMKQKADAGVSSRLDGYSSSDVYKKLFNKDGERGQMDAFGQGYSNKGIGV
jgi:hypothetical protein